MYLSMIEYQKHDWCSVFGKKRLCFSRATAGTFSLNLVYCSCLIYGDILLQCLSRPQIFAARVMLLKKVFKKFIFELFEKRWHTHIFYKCSSTIILFGKIFQALTSYQRPFFFIFNKNHWKMGKNRKNRLFSKASLNSEQKFHALRLLHLDTFSKSYGYLQRFIY